MQDTAASVPGLYFRVQPPATQPAPLGTDVAGFIGPTRRGPLGEAVRVEGWRHFQSVFGGLIQGVDTPYALRGYFENGGQAAYVKRVLGTPATGRTLAQGIWQVGDLDPVTHQWPRSAPAAGGFSSARYRVTASSPGVWANGTRVLFRYQLRGADGRPQVDIEVHVPGEPVEYLAGLPPARLVEAVAQRSQLIRLQAEGPQPAPGGIGPLSLSWEPVMLVGASETAPSLTQYLPAVRQLDELPEPALLALPDLHRLPAGEAPQLLATLVALADARLDRLVLVAPPPLRDAVEAVRWLAERRTELGRAARSLAVYHPALRVPDPLGSISAPLREISPVGHVAGVISRLDRERGAHHTPANALLYEAMDVAVTYDLPEQGILANNGVNLLRCVPGRGLQIWGGRTTADPVVNPTGLFIAHRRLLHRLVRAIHRVAAPLVFDNNGPRLWLTLVRAITTVLLQAYRAGALQGQRPEEAFRVRCDESTNPPEAVDQGLVQCEVELAPAVPMEFITLRIAVSAEGRLEVIEP